MIFFIGCADKTGDFFDVPGLGTGSTDYLAIMSADTNTRSISLFTVAGEYVSLLKDFRTDLGNTRGLAFVPPTQIFASLDTTDRIHELEWSNGQLVTDQLFTSSGLNGNIYDIEGDALGNLFVVHSNQIRRFDSTGVQVGNPYINTTTGACVLSNPRGMFLTSDNRLIVTNQGGSDEVVIYDVSSTTNPTCLSHNAIGNNPYGVVLHSDGYMYLTTQGNDQIYRADADGSNLTAIFTTNTSIFNDPTAIVELPNGNLAISSAITDTVWEMDTSGSLVGVQPLINSPLSLNIIDMEVVSSGSQ